MKLAEALIKRADLVRKLNEVKSRISSNATVQEGEKPNEDPETLADQAASIINELAFYIKMINQTNSSTKMGELTITDAIALRDSLKMESELYRQIADWGTVNAGMSRYSRTEIKSVSAINVNKYRQLADDTAAKFRKLDTAIQAVNWNTDLIETDAKFGSYE